MTSLRSVVSGDRRRFIQDGYDLDLTYITNNIIAMGLPSAGIVESTYRNHIDDVSRMLKQYHSDHFMVWNTTSERKYDYEKFNNQVLEFGWPDHHTPPLALIFQACQSMYSWLSSDPKNVAVVHCKAGKGRTGTLICCFLLYANIMSTPGLAMKYFARRRGTSGLMRGGVTIPSQKRYIHYFHRVLSGFRPHGRAMRLTRIIVNGTANFDSKGGCKPYCKIFQIQRGEERLLFTGKHGLITDGTTSHDTTTRGRSATLSTEHTTVIRVGLVVSGDVLIRFKHKGSILNPNMCRCAFNTEFFPETGGTFRFNKQDMDDGYKDKRIYSDFSVDLELEPIMDVPVSDPFPWAPMLQQRVRAIPHIKLLPVSVPAKRTRATTADPTSAHHHLTRPPQSVKLALASHTAPPTSSLFVAAPTTDTRPSSISTSTTSESASAAASSFTSTSASATSTTSDPAPTSSESASEPAPEPAPAAAAALSQPDTTPDTVTSLVTSLVGAALSDDDEEIDAEEAEECLEDEEDDDDEPLEEDVKGEERKAGSTKSTPNISSSPLEPHHIDLNEIDLLNPATRDRLPSTFRPPLPVKRKASARPPSSAESSPHSSSYKTGSSIFGTDPVNTRPTSHSVGASPSPHIPIFTHSPHSPSLLTGMLSRVTSASFSGERQRSDARTVGGLLLGRHSQDSPRGTTTTTTAISIMAQTRPLPLDTISPTSSPPLSTPNSPSKPPLPVRKLKKPEVTPRQHATSISNGIHPDVISLLVAPATGVEPPPVTVEATSTPATASTGTEPNAEPASAVAVADDGAAAVSSPADVAVSQ